MNNMELLLECGFVKPVAKLDLVDKVNVIQSIALHKVILNSLGELADFKKGLQALGVSDAMKKHRGELRPFFCNDEQVELTSGQANFVVTIP